ncbi:LppU/SCO3897 family protein [Streptomyces gobiensis]|uniref:LppU/SCO3897 family protein n=1 Tax=Streptomyces gobiensis TaxID=2875706 RepID=UPI001E48D0D1|nr:hypothetical protein [Streptomyces gobiensis]UGY92456.1 hypothetical protein test1122_12485 [Streptomyces gobiensis]
MSNSYGPPGQFGPGAPGPPPGPPPSPQMPYGPPFPPGGPQGPRRNNGATVAIIVICGGLGLVLIAGLALAFGLGWFDSTSGNRAKGPSISGAPTYDSDSGYSSGGSYDTPTPEPTTATPDPTATAFKAVSAGDCLTVYDTGYGGSTAQWSTDVPPAPISCRSEKALVQVTKVTTYSSSCSSGTGKSYWSYRSTTDGETTVLCLTRIYHKNYCLLGKQTGTGSNARISLGPMTAVNCTDKKVPTAYNQIMHITGVYQAPANASARNCARVQGDQTTYWAWTVNDGKTLLCTTIFRG